MKRKSLFIISTISTFLIAGDTKVDLLVKDAFMYSSPNCAQLKLLGRKHPPLELYDHYKFGDIKIEQSRQIIVVDFWATWCAPCLGSLLINSKLSDKYKNRGVCFIGACGSGKGEEKMVSTVQAWPITIPVAKVKQSTSLAWKIKAYPSLGIIDRNGILRAINVHPKSVEPIIDALLIEQPR